MVTSIRIGNSKRHGVGVFSTQIIPKGTHITCYGDIVTDNQWSEYAMDFPDGIARTGDPMTRNINKCGHLLNDKAIIHLSPSDNINDARRKIEEYNSQMEHCNTVFRDSYGNLESKRDIDINEELTYSYGPIYWLSQETSHNEHPMMRFMASILLREIEPTLGYNTAIFKDEDFATRFIFEFLKVRPNGWEGWRVLGCENKSSIEKLRHFYLYIIHGKN